MKTKSEQVKRLKLPVQKRSQETLDRIFSATEELLTRKRYSEISIAEIASAAGCGVGTFYGRFRNKDALLASMEERVVQSIVDRQELFLGSRDWTTIGFEQRASSLTGHIAQGYRIHGPVLRELISTIHQTADGASGNSREKMNHVFRRDVDFLLDGLGKMNRQRTRKILGIAQLSVILTLQNRMLQLQTSPIGQEFSGEFLESELSKMVIAYVRSVL